MSTQSLSSSLPIPSLPTKSDCTPPPATTTTSHITPSPVDEQIIAAQMIDQLQYVNTQYHTQQQQYNHYNNINDIKPYSSNIITFDNRINYPSLISPHTQYNIQQQNNNIQQQHNNQPDQLINDENQLNNTDTLNSLSSNGSSCHQCKTRRCTAEMYYCNGTPVNKRSKLSNGQIVKQNKKKTRICRKKYVIYNISCIY